MISFFITGSHKTFCKISLKCDAILYVITKIRKLFDACSGIPFGFKKTEEDIFGRLPEKKELQFFLTYS